MSRGLVVGISWFEDGERIERVAAAQDGTERQAIDRIVAVTPEDIRKEVAQWFAPLLEHNEPKTPGKYQGESLPGPRRAYWVWWKRAYIEES